MAKVRVKTGPKAKKTKTSAKSGAKKAAAKKTTTKK
jgi:hypothetical protein